MDEPILFQYELVVSPGQGFVVYARRKDGGEIVELSLRAWIGEHGELVAGEIKAKRTP